MMATLKSEFRKVITVRSTYGLLLFTLFMLGVFAFYGEGMRAGGSEADPQKLASAAKNAITAMSIFASLVGALLVTHEYRYNTIVYTLTSSRSRLRVMLAKLLVVSVFAILFTILVGVLSPAFAYVGMAVKGLHLVHQTIPYSDLVWKALFTGWGYSVVALLFAMLIRNQVGTLAAVFLFQGTVEPLLGLVLKTNAAYLPYNALNSVMINEGARFSAAKCAAIFTMYMIVGWVVGLILFVRRDAN